ncbi:uncharacterized protein [Porites lutea]|uniref:uncharacterized protein n=1 Tax=Porites lutea TaxID=51062 RepID=UPI003CC5FC5E
MTTEISIEREANLRAQKKKILRLQRLKYLTGKLEISDALTANDAENEDASFAQGKEEKSSDQLCTKEPPVVAYEEVNEKLTNGSVPDGNSDRSGNEPFAPKHKSPVLLRRKRHDAEVTVEQCQKLTNIDSSKFSIVVDNTTELERYTPSVASLSSEYHRKTIEIKKKADERRRNVGSPRYTHHTLLNLSSNSHSLAVNNLQLRRSSSLTELRHQDNQEEIQHAQHATINHGIRCKSEDVRVGTPNGIAEHETAPFPLRATSMSSITDVCLTTEKEDMNFGVFARKQQERLEDNLRRVEQNLDSTFSKLRRYINATNEILETVKLKEDT